MWPKACGTLCMMQAVGFGFPRGLMLWRSRKPIDGDPMPRRAHLLHRLVNPRLRGAVDDDRSARPRPSEFALPMPAVEPVTIAVRPRKPIFADLPSCFGAGHS